MYETLSNKSTIIIKNKAMEIADSQTIINNENKSSRTTIYKYVQEKYKDSFCDLNSDIIDYIGSFLTKHESIEFGYLNKQLYIETQKLSYLLQRCKDEKFGCRS